MTRIQMDIIIKDIWQIIFNQLDFMSQTNLRQVSKYFTTNHPIINLYNDIPNRHKLTDKIFSPDMNTTRKGTVGEVGSGFGLPLVYSYIRKFRGSIEVESRCIEDHPNDLGTSFTFYLEKVVLPEEVDV